MPTTTSLSNFYFVNAGPLTTTFTLPESCSTAGYTGLARTSSDEVFPYYQLDCENDEFGACYPGTSGQDLHASLSTGSPDPTYQAFLYYSPGVHCPSGWTTAGTAARNSDGQLTTSGDVYNAHIMGTKTVEIDRNPPEHIFAQALDKGETAALCCPSGYAAAKGGFQCHSPLPMSDVEATSVCQRVIVDGVENVPATFTYGGATITGEILTDVEPTRVFSTEYERLDPTLIREEGLAPMTYMPIVTLVHREDEVSASDNDDDSDEDNSGDEGGESDESEGSGQDQGSDGNEDAASLHWTTAGLMAAVWGSAAAVGAALMV